MNHLGQSPLQKALAVSCALLLVVPFGFAQAPLAQAPPPGDPAAPLISPQELDNLVAPIALYPDPLLGQVLAAATYPLEVEEATQWLQQNGGLRGQQLMDAARQQNWDPSVQALVAFPDALRLLGNDIRWTEALGNAFLAQESDVMAAVQRMRSRAQANGRLATNPQEVVDTTYQDGQSAIQIMPADPQVIYVPVYDPAYVYGPPVWGAYPDLWYPAGFGFGFSYGPGIYLSSFFPGWGGWGGWGWGCGWFGSGLFVNTVFFNHYGYRGGWGGWRDGYRDGYRGGFGGGRFAWSHDPVHRGGIPYASRAVASRFNSTNFAGSGRFAGGGANRFAGTAGGGFNRGSGNVSSGFNRGTTTPSTANRFTGGAGPAGARSGNWNRFSGSATTNNFSRGQTYNRGTYNGGAYNGARNYSGSNFADRPAPSQNFRGRSTFNGGANSGRSGSTYSAPRSQSFAAPSRNFSAPSGNYSAPSRNFSAPNRSFSAPRSENFSAPSRSFSAPRSENFSAPNRSFSAPRSENFSAPSRSFSAPRSENFSAPSRSFSAPRSENFSAPSRSFSPPPAQGFSGQSRSFSAPSRSFSAPAPRSGGGFSGGGGGGRSNGGGGGGGHNNDGGGGHRR